MATEKTASKDAAPHADRHPSPQNPVSRGADIPAAPGSATSTSEPTKGDPGLPAADTNEPADKPAPEKTKSGAKASGKAREEAKDAALADQGITWTDEVGIRGRVITVSKGPKDGPTQTYEEVVPVGNDDAANEAKARLQARISR